MHKHIFYTGKTLHLKSNHPIITCPTFSFFHKYNRPNPTCFTELWKETTIYFKSRQFSSVRSEHRTPALIILRTKHLLLNLFDSSDQLIPIFLEEQIARAEPDCVAKANELQHFWEQWNGINGTNDSCC